MRFFAAFLALAALLSSAPAAAQVVRGEDKVVYKQKTVIDVSDVEVTGDPPLNETSWIVSTKAGPFPSLIKVRASFDRELSASTDKL